MNTKFERSLVASALIQPMRPAIKPIAINKTTGSREEKTGLFNFGNQKNIDPILTGKPK
jgi:hypothetical protein